MAEENRDKCHRLLTEASTSEIINELMSRKVPFVFVSRDIDAAVLEDKNKYWVSHLTSLSRDDIDKLSSSLIHVLARLDEMNNPRTKEEEE